MTRRHDGFGGSVVLVDTSVWIEVFRRGGDFRLEDELELDEIVTCLPVVQEVLQGFRDETLYREAAWAMWAFPLVESPMPSSLFTEAIELYRRARRGGITVRSSVDCLIAACALRHDLEVLHRDRDFASLAAVTPLRARSIHR